MSFFLSKVLWAVVNPLNALFIILGMALLVPRLRAPLIAASLVTLAFLGIMPGAEWIAQPLENRFPAPVLPDHVDGIIVLGGSLNPHIGMGRGQPNMNGTGERLVEFAALARRYPTAKAVFTGGNGLLFQTDGQSEAVQAAQVFAHMGLPKDRIIFESTSRNTWENALFSQELVKPAPQETWILVTSALHMPRSVGIFQKVGWSVIPYPCDYQTSVSEPFEFRFRILSGLLVADIALREYVGLVAYYMMGRTSHLFPAP